MRGSTATGTAIALATICGFISVASASAALLLAPAFLLLLILSLGFFPGEKVIERIRSRRSRSRELVRTTVPKIPRVLDLARRTGLDLAYALAVRPPPLISVRHI
jgi:hypothetical protein